MHLWFDSNGKCPDLSLFHSLKVCLQRRVFHLYHRKDEGYDRYNLCFAGNGKSHWWVECWVQALTAQSCWVSDTSSHVIPLYVHRVKQERMQSASKRPVTQVNGLPASSAGTDKEATVDDDRERCQRFTRLVLGVLFMILQNQSLARFILAETDHPSRTSLGKER